MPGPVHDGKGSSCIPSMIPKSSNTAAILVGQEFKIKQGTRAGWKPGKDFAPVGLVLVAVRELDVCVVQRN